MADHLKRKHLHGDVAFVGVRLVNEAGMGGGVIERYDLSPGIWITSTRTQPDFDELFRLRLPLTMVLKNTNIGSVKTYIYFHD